MTYTGTNEELEQLGYQINFTNDYYFKSILKSNGKPKKYNCTILFVDIKTRAISVEGTDKYLKDLLQEIKYK